MGIAQLNTIDLSLYKGILWDLDDTLYDYPSAHRIAYQETKTSALNLYQISNADFDLHWDLARKENHKHLHGQAASHSRILYLQLMHEKMQGYTNAEFALTLEEVYWSHFLKVMQWHAGIEEFLKKAKAANLQMAVVTDLTTQIQLRKWKHLDLGRFMLFMISSEEAGKEKPNSDIFELALRKLNLKPEEVLMVGDNFDKDIQGAEHLGIQSVLFK